MTRRINDDDSNDGTCSGVVTDDDVFVNNIADYDDDDDDDHDNDDNDSDENDFSEPHRFEWFPWMQFVVALAWRSSFERLHRFPSDCQPLTLFSSLPPLHLQFGLYTEPVHIQYLYLYLCTYIILHAKALFRKRQGYYCAHSGLQATQWLGLLCGIRVATLSKLFANTCLLSPSV